MRGSPFFDGVRQIDSTVLEEPAKMPCFYYDSSSMTAMFPARLGGLRAIMPDPQYVPAALVPGLGIVAVSYVENRDSDIGAYSYLAIAVPLHFPADGANIPGRALLRSVRSRETHIYVHHMPETSARPIAAGIEYYNFPKFLASLDVSDDGGVRSCRLAEGREHILTLHGRRIPARKSAVVRQFCHQWMDGQPQTAEIKGHQRELGRTVNRGAATLELGDRHPIAVELDRLLVSRHALMYEYVPSLEAILFGPEHMTPVLLSSTLDAIDRGRRLTARTT